MLFGKYGSDGIEDDPDICVLTGEDIEPGDCRVQITGTPYFVHVKAHAINRLTPEKMAELVSLLPKDEPPAQAVTQTAGEEPPPLTRKSRSAAVEADKKEG